MKNTKLWPDDGGMNNQDSGLVLWYNVVEGLINEELQEDVIEKKKELAKYG